MELSRTRARRLPAITLVAALAVACGASALPEGAHGAAGVTAPSTRTMLAERDWARPVVPFRVVRAFIAPAHEYGPGHRGIDVEAPAGADVSAPASGIVAFSGMVAGRGILTIDHGDGLVSTFEPVQSVLSPGTPVGKGEHIGAVTSGGHAPLGQLHFGVRLNDSYINPMLLLGEVPRAILLPCCE